MSDALKSEYEAKLRTLVVHAWESEVNWFEIESWVANFDGQIFDEIDEQLYGLFVLSRFMYFGKRLLREMLRSLYRDHFRSSLCQRIRRNYGGTIDSKLICKVFNQELAATRFIGVGNPAESGAHLLYYFRQVNRLPKNLFVDINGAFHSTIDRDLNSIQYLPKDSTVTRYVFFDDLVGSGTQVSDYLGSHLRRIQNIGGHIDLRFMSLFATTKGLEKLNGKDLFDGRAMCLFELDDSYRAFDGTCRYFNKPPSWFQPGRFFEMAKGYGDKLNPRHPLGYKDGQLLLGFAHNTPDNVPPIFWDEGHQIPWKPIFVRYDKNYGGLV